MRRIAFTIGLAGALTGAAAARPFDPRDHRVFAGPASEVLVLGTPHLSGLPKTFDPAVLSPLLDRLAAWKPDVIAIEALSGPQCDYLRRYADLHAGAARDYCWDPTPAAKATGLDVAAATLAVERQLAAWPATPTAAQRRHLAALFLAGGDRASALVQWLRLPPGERVTGDGLDDPLVALLEKIRTAHNENYLIAAALAARLGLERVHPVDDHTADGPAGDEAGFGAAMTRAWNNPIAKQRRVDDEAAYARTDTAAGTLALYRAYNAPRTAEVAFTSDFGAALNDPSPQHFGRQYAAWWETRNLRMVANMRAILTPRPGARMLTIVGASHKGYYEAYLGMMHDIRLADTGDLLR